MGAGGRVDAGIGKAQALDRPPGDEMLAYQFVHVGEGDEAVPDCVRVNNDRNTVFTLIEAAGGVYANIFGEAGFLHRGLERLADGFGVLAEATAARVINWPLVGADEQVALKSRHSYRSGGRQPTLRVS